MGKRLIIGTANFTQTYKGHCVHEKEVEKIIQYALDNGVDTFDSADAYNNMYYLSDFPIKIQYKTDRIIPECFESKTVTAMRHHPTTTTPNYLYGGLSLYDPDYLYHLEKPLMKSGFILQTPLIKIDTLKQISASGFHVQARNVMPLFLSPDFKDVLDNLWFVDSFVVGVDNLDQAKKNIDKFNEATK